MRNTAFTDHDSHSLMGRGDGICQDCVEGTGPCAYTPAFRVEDSRFLDDTAEYDGRGIYLYGSDGVLEDITFTGNRAWYPGGGLAGSGGSLTVRDSDLRTTRLRITSTTPAREVAPGGTVKVFLPLVLRNR